MRTATPDLCSPCALPPRPHHMPRSSDGRSRRKSTPALAQLPENRRLAVKNHLQGLTTPEIGALLGWSEPKARNLVHRGLKDLRTALRALGIEYQVMTLSEDDLRTLWQERTGECAVGPSPVSHRDGLGASAVEADGRCGAGADRRAHRFVLAVRGRIPSPPAVASRGSRMPSACSHPVTVPEPAVGPDGARGGRRLASRSR